MRRTLGYSPNVPTILTSQNCVWLQLKTSISMASYHMTSDDNGEPPYVDCFSKEELDASGKLNSTV
uniref:Uncharacterized protein n=1 Tax=Kwoniella pini CBS 10737 TaxID=1296096 RepID=A0A1B9IAK2_9TREE|nr:uncharacterized protein I206_01882 [Kwoniella pini CBS 10737]OCF52589.1 hypothetical protein I206_01882 [Kwoniella pini CBS 10737]